MQGLVHNRYEGGGGVRDKILLILTYPQTSNYLKSVEVVVFGKHKNDLPDQVNHSLSPYIKHGFDMCLS